MKRIDRLRVHSFGASSKGAVLDEAEKKTAVGKSATLTLGKRANVYSIHKHLRDLIFSGKIKPGTILAQGILASEIGVSRTRYAKPFGCFRTRD